MTMSFENLSPLNLDNPVDIPPEIPDGLFNNPPEIEKIETRKLLLDFSESLRVKALLRAISDFFHNL